MNRFDLAALPNHDARKVADSTAGGGLGSIVGSIAPSAMRTRKGPATTRKPRTESTPGCHGFVCEPVSDGPRARVP